MSCLAYTVFCCCVSVYLFERENTHSMNREGAGRQRETEREGGNPKQAPRCQHRARPEAQSHEPWGRDLSRNQESGAQLTEPPRRPLVLLLMHPES